MSKKKRRNTRQNRASATTKPKRVVIPFVERPFEGLPLEMELVAMREILPLATVDVRTTEEYGSAQLTLASILPGMAAAIRREDGVLLVAMQTVMHSGDASLDIAARIIAGLELQAGETFHMPEQPEPGPRMQDVLDLESFETFTLYEEPTFWMTPEEAAKPDNRDALRSSREQLVPTAAVDGVPGAYWCRMSREFLRWVRPEPRDRVLDGLARLRVAGQCTFDESRFVGAFRAQGLLIPVWELQPGSEADELVQPLAEFASVLDAAISSTEPLTADEKRARAGIVSRQVTLR
ncbi:MULTISPECIES: DUF5926 family protein [unclassified Actinobaculum]|uniref:DUF5926 family protein n=1 Tax=unclassified Actinobaculum TaxID=2609299 RepID=UPI000D526392|nr:MULTISPECIES: DUF5926 family protein [unclassified Actinobaculum]AWE41563.1 topoisomerase II [Actinobaculum sp. 313]RTE49177.1 topoisomerase II [Actinobaculum sp. 352]